MTDDVAWRHFPEHRWVYNKLEVALSQNIPCAPLGVMPEEYPVALKPAYNIWGGGVGSYRIDSADELFHRSPVCLTPERARHPGTFWMEWLEGDHLSHDLVTDGDGFIEWVCCLEGHPLGVGMFDRWETTEPDRLVVAYVSAWVRRHLQGYRGCVNLETIGGKIIDCHLRPGDLHRFGDERLMRSLADFCSGEPWNFDGRLGDLYLFVVWGRQGVDYVIDDSIVADICGDFVSFRMDDPDWINPLGAARIAILTARDLRSGLDARHRLLPHFRPEIPGELSRF